MINELKLNNNPKWVNYGEIVKYTKLEINEIKLNLNEDEVNKYFDMLNDLEDNFTIKIKIILMILLIRILTIILIYKMIQIAIVI